MREDLDGCLEDGLEKCDVWFLALEALQSLGATLDEACLDRLFWREKRMVSSQLDCDQQDILLRTSYSVHKKCH